MRIYVASSWRNTEPHAQVVALLRAAGHHVYDFRNPVPATGFAWAELGIAALATGAAVPLGILRDAIAHPRAIAGFESDMDALRSADATVLVLPCGRSAHLELGYAVGAGQRTIVYGDAALHFDPELMYRMCSSIVDSPAALLAALAPESEDAIAVADVNHTEGSDFARSGEWQASGRGFMAFGSTEAEAVAKLARGLQGRVLSNIVNMIPDETIAASEPKRHRFVSRFRVGFEDSCSVRNDVGDICGEDESAEIHLPEGKHYIGWLKPHVTLTTENGAHE